MCTFHSTKEDKRGVSPLSFSLFLDLQLTARPDQGCSFEISERAAKIGKESDLDAYWQSRAGWGTWWLRGDPSLSLKGALGMGNEGAVFLTFYDSLCSPIFQQNGRQFCGSTKQ